VQRPKAETRVGEPEPERPEPHDLVGAILFFLQEPERDPEHFKKLELDPELESELA